jgi:hypothetical protein
MLLRVLWLRTSLSIEVGFGAAMCHMTPCGSWASSIKKSLAGLPVQLGTHVFNAHVHIFKASDIMVIMDLQDVYASNTVNACKACRQAGIVRLQCSTSIMDNSPSTVTVSSDCTTRRHTADRV